ncbi:Serine/threonine-protein kinase PK-1 [Caulifigura coniformis]|uniref:non-specific serine/threonine protein kinase n=1 Tax=Caulifigura coniformis TaxID=2527983 RepID=A0A517SK43_9PLAN|nr:serine/threonine-protein kinase [Caulifigura coniformis]QDT56492.1 Serine/threonine-protein kinase PK-1 [Caulifigura coniformis]
MPAETPARRVGPFQLEEKLGVGGMGVVYKATYLKTGQKVALKMLAPDLTADPKVAKRFEREMEILQKLKHPNIIRYYGGSTTGNQRWYAMELIAGGSMDRIIKEKGKIAWEDVIDYGIQIAMALEHSHAAGIIHRDLKPANLLLAPNNTVKLTDFGIARDTDATALTQAGKTVGTMAYMAPEQITGKQPVSRKTDLYSLGCVLFEMLTGKTPFEAPTQPEVMFKHLEAEPPSVRELAWQTPVWLEELIEELLAKDPNDRPFDALAVQVKLQEVKKKVADKKTVVGETKGAAAGVTMHGDAVVTKAHTKKKKKKKEVTPVYERGWFLALTFLVVVGGAAGWYLLKRYKPEDQRFAEVQQAVQSGEIDDLLNAESLIERMHADFPEGKHKDAVQRMLDDISAIRAERNLNLRLNLGKDPETEGERLWVNAKQFEKAGDRVIALEKYRAMEKLLSKDAGERPFRSLARRQAEKIEAEIGGKGDRTAFINQWLVDADTAFRKGNRAEAQKIWKSIYDLYGSMPEFHAQVQQADARLARPESALAPPAPPAGTR